jgi:Zn-dependent protease with chaperone function
MLVKKIKRLVDIDPKSWEHPADKAALSVLKQMNGFDDLVKLFLSVTFERSLKLMSLSSNVKVSSTQFPVLNRVINDVVDIFDWDYKPNVFMTQSPFWNAGAFGVKEPFIILNSAMVSSCDENEITVVMAHEMGHIMSGHVLYKTLLWLLTNVSFSLLPIPRILVLPILAALYEWDRKSELTADRAGLLAGQSPELSYNILMKMSGAYDLTQVDINDFFLQAQEYENQKSFLDGVHKILNQLWKSHPFPVVRLQELRTWEASGYYQSILDGNYLRKGTYKSDTKEEVKAGFNSYMDDLKQNDTSLSNIAKDFVDDLGKAAGEAGKAAGKIGGSLRDMLRNAAEGKDKKSDS